ncbi:hypothetical protein N185_34530 [Sinorhizobium sp. GW3]|nr:hypothetical protein N185_34530 [Sinorhizobium sp. GW3]
MKTALIILDGMGLSTSPIGNAVTPAFMPFIFRTMSHYGAAQLEASGEAVGLRKGVVGNSEVGHLTIGAGRTVTSTLCRTDRAYEDGSWRTHPLWKQIVRGERLHVVGLLSDAGVHAHLDTIWRCAELAVTNGVASVVVHLLLDGVDSPAGSATQLFAQLEGKLGEIPNTSFGMVMGRKWFCDRGASSAPANFFADSLSGLDSLPHLGPGILASLEHEHDFAPHVHSRVPGIRPGEAILLTSHRADRALHAARVLTGRYRVYSLIPLGEAVPEHLAFFPFDRLTSGIATEVAAAGLKTTRIAESCKFPHVTSFFDGLNDNFVARRFCVPSPKEDELQHRPEMEIGKIVATVIAEMEQSDSDLLIVNIANLDQIGHLGRLDLARLAAEYVDSAARDISQAASRTGWTTIFLSDHGNADQVETADGRPYGSHTDRPVPLTIIPHSGLNYVWLQRSGTLANVAATVLASVGLVPPAAMDAPLLSFTAVDGAQIGVQPRQLMATLGASNVQLGRPS